MDDNDFMKMALVQAENALAAGEFPVGCVVAYPDRTIVTGARKGTSGCGENEVDHAEIVALRRLSDVGEKIERRRVTLYCTMEPCLMCFGAILLSGIGRIVYAYEDVMGGGTACDLSSLTPLYKKCHMAIVSGVLRGESLVLFKKYFQNSSNSYWRGSLLANYTLEQ
jgi:tRNA(adenine34) deaminase